MAVSPVEAILLAEAFGGRILRDARHPGPASYDGTGTRFVYVPAATTETRSCRYALDVEARAVACPDSLAAALGCADDPGAALRRWTELEVLAKLTDTPVHLLLRARPDKITTGIEITRCDTKTHWVVVGMRKT